MGAGITFLFLLHPLFGAEFPPPGDGSQYDLLADRNREIIDELARELVALVAALYLFIVTARFNRAGLAVCPHTLGEAAVAYQVFGFGAVYRGQLLPEFFVVVPGGHVDSADPAI
jgi:hypothetical protein